MKKEDFEKLLKEKSPEDIIRMHCMNKIYLCGYQFDKVQKLRDKKEVRK